MRVIRFMYRLLLLFLSDKIRPGAGFSGKNLAGKVAGLLYICGVVIRRKKKKTNLCVIKITQMYRANFVEILNFLI